MEKYIKLFILIGILTQTLGCSEGSKFSSKESQTPKENIVDPITPYTGEPGTTDPNYAKYHCGDITGQEHYFYSFMKNVYDKNTYSSFLASQGNCSNYNGWIKTENGTSVFYEYQQNLGTTNCSWWSQQPMGIWISFFKGYPNQATIAIDATGDGWATGGGQGFPVRRSVLYGEIDCSSEDLTIWAPTQTGWLNITVPKQYGNKNGLDMRATIFFNGNKIGTTFLRRN